jgi:hypothetical protein
MISSNQRALIVVNRSKYSLAPPRLPDCQNCQILLDPDSPGNIHLKVKHARTRDLAMISPCRTRSLNAFVFANPQFPSRLYGRRDDIVSTLPSSNPKTGRYMPIGMGKVISTR